MILNSPEICSCKSQTSSLIKIVRAFSIIRSYGPIRHTVPCPSYQHYIIARHMNCCSPHKTKNLTPLLTHDTPLSLARVSVVRLISNRGLPGDKYSSRGQDAIFPNPFTCSKTVFSPSYFSSNFVSAQGGLASIPMSKRHSLLPRYVRSAVPCAA
jgi:hypothetical protein